MKENRKLKAMKYFSTIESVGSALPDKRLSTSELIQDLNIGGIELFEYKTGIKEKRICSEEDNSLSLAAAASRDCLSRSIYKASDLDMVISCSISKYNQNNLHQYEPALALNIKKRIGATHALHFDIGNACAGMMTGLLIAQKFVENGTFKNCLVVSGESISVLSDHALKNIKNLHSQELPSLTVGDAGAAFIIARTENAESGIITSGYVTLSQYNDLCLGRHGYDFPKTMMETKAQQIHKASITESVPIIHKALMENNLKLSDIDHFIPHQTSISAIQSGKNALLKYFEVLPQHIVVNLKYYGNTASTTHFLALSHLLNKKEIKKDDRIMMVTYASGIVIGLAIFKLNNILERYGS